MCLIWGGEALQTTYGDMLRADLYIFNFQLFQQAKLIRIIVLASLI
jgi:hypothetical protein